MDLDGIKRRVSGLAPKELVTDPRAAVAAILRPGDEGPEVLLIERAARIGDPWSGQMAFPGGHRIDGEHALDTARRETMEEVAIDLREHELFGPLSDVPTHRTGLVVRPYVFALKKHATPTPLVSEVADTLWMPIAPMMRGEINGTYQFRPEGTDIALDLPCFRVPDPRNTGRVVWGLTHRMLEILFDVIRGD